MDNKTKFVIFNVVGCAAFLTLPIFLFPHPPGETEFIFSRPTQRDLIGNFIMLLFFYLNYYWLIPTLYFKKQYLFYAVSILIGFWIIASLPSLITGHDLFQKDITTVFQPSIRPQRPTGFTFIEEIRHHIFLFLSVILFSILLRVRDRLIKTQRAKHEAEVSFLKAQINPHFLFNTLNSIYALAINKDDGTPDAVVQLSEMMRYIIRDANNNMVLLEKEVDYLGNYIALQKQRLGNTVIVMYTFEGDATGKQIIPLILIPFIENAFKHGVNPESNSSISIDITLKEKELRMVVANNKVSGKSDGQGIGLKNSKERLQIGYPSRHRLSVTDLADTFTIDLSIIL